MVASKFDLGDSWEQRAELHGGVNRLWRVRSSSGGEFAVHQLRGVNPDADGLDRCQWIAGLEAAAIAAGVRAPAPLLDRDTGRAAIVVPGWSGVFVVHHWYDAARLEPDGFSTRFARSLGDALARVHALGHPPPPGAADALERHPTLAEWEELADGGAGRAVETSELRSAAPALVAALDDTDAWDGASGAGAVTSHRDLTSANLLNDQGEAVLIDWESAGRTLTSAEIGRTALDNFLRGDSMDRPALAAFLEGYARRMVLPPVGPDWCSLWIRGLVVFAEQCARSLLHQDPPASLAMFQQQVVAHTPSELARRLRMVGRLLEQFESAAPEVGDLDRTTER